jgi:DNA-binding LacI/PurR family transcriptional regulator
LRKGNRVTLRDVAAASDVSRATAGFVLSNSPHAAISEATRERVLRAAHDLGYVPHGIARALREGSSRIVVLSIDRGLDGNYARSYIDGLDTELAAHGHTLLVQHGTHDSAQQVLDAIAPRAVLQFAGNYLEPGHELDDGGWNGGLAGNSLVQLRYLVSRGHTSIALALPEDDQPLGPVRLRFATEAAQTLSIAAPPPLMVPKDRAIAARALEAFLAAHGQVTAVAAFDDETALRLLAVIGDLSLTAPDDLAVIGFDDTEYGALSTPALTTVHIDAEDHGRHTARAILGLDTDGFIAAPARVIVRESA